MLRLTPIAAASLAALVGMAAPAFAQSQAEFAAKANEEGKELMYANKYAEASARFRDAVARVPEPKYFFNLCTSLFQEGKFGEALTACNAVDNNSPSPEQKTKVDKLRNRIKDEAKAQGISVEPVGGGQSPGETTLDCAATPQDSRCQQPPPVDRCKANPRDPACAAPPPPHPNPNQPPPQNFAVGRPPTGTGLFTATRPDNRYTWTLGFDLFGGGGQVGQPDYYGSASGGFRVKGDYLLNAPRRFGAQGYMQLTHFGAGSMDSSFVSTLDIFDVGVALYKHLCPPSTQRLCLTPLAGVQLALMSPAGEMDETGSQLFNYAAVGARLEMGAQFAFGSRNEHVLSALLGLNLYTPVFSGPSEFDDGLSIEDAGLDRGGASAYIGIGYTYRFNTPLGSSPFITLE
jgi:hypothetical protein